MTDWQWECFERYTHSGLFGVTDAGPLLSPIRTFKITRNCKLGLVLETLVVGEAQASSAPVHSNGTVRLTTETMEFAGNGGIHCTAHGVLPFSTSDTHNAELVKETTQKAQVHSLTARLRNDVAPAYTIDWLGNLNRGVYVWRGSSISEKRETVDILTLGYGAGAIELSAHALPLPSMNFSTLEMVIAGVRLFLCDCVPEASKGIERSGYIFYVGNPTDEVRTKIRQVLSFCLGNYLVYLGSTMLSEESEIVSFSAMSPPSIGRVSEIGSVRISVCEAFEVKSRLALTGQVIVSGEWPGRQARNAGQSMFLGSIMASVPSSRPAIASASRACQVKFAAERRDRSHAQPPLRGEHGEDPQFDRAEHGARLRQTRGYLVDLHVETSIKLHA